MYIRLYPKMVTVPVLGQLFNAISAVGNFVIERQDRRVVNTQEPGRAAGH